MGKDREGRFIPLKGKPSGSGREGKLGLRPGMEAGDLQQDREITGRYTVNDEAPAPNVRMRHPNRNVEKGDENEIAAINKVQNSYKRRTDTAVDGQLPSPEALPPYLSREEFATLAAYTGDCCITLVQPTHRGGMEVNELQDSIAFKNALQDVQQQLLQQGRPVSEVEPLLLPAFALANDDDFWRAQLNGLAVFLSDGAFRYMRLPYTPERWQYTGQHFDTSALLPMLTSHEQFFILMLTKRKATLFEVDLYGIRERTAKELHLGVDDMLMREGKEEQPLNGRDATDTGFHGAGAGLPADRSNISAYMAEVDEWMWNEVLSSQHVPLLLAGEESLFPFFRRRSRYRHITDTSMPGHFEQEHPQTLCAKAREKVQPYLEIRLRKALDRYYNAIATPLTSSMPEEVIRACFYARADVLFVQRGFHLWGWFDEADNRIALHAAPEPGDACMVNAAAVKAYLNAAEVFLLDAGRMPNGAQVAALMRYGT